MVSFCRRNLAKLCIQEIQESMDEIGFYAPLSALLAEFAALECENEKLRCENKELTKMAFRLNEDLPGEIWRDVEGYEGLYQVSNFVKFKSFYRDRISILLPNFGGRYATIGLTKNGHCKTFVVHRIIAKAFVPNPDLVNKTVVHRKNNDKYDNRPENLMWVTSDENNAFALADGLKRNVRRRRFSDGVVRYIRENPKGLSYSGLARELGVWVSTISLIANGKTYKDVK